MPKKLKKALSVTLLAAVAGVIYYYVAIYSREAGPGPINTTGIVEAVETNVSSRIPGMLEFVGFREGDRVKAGELIASIQDADLRASLSKAKSAAAAAEAALGSGYDAVDKARADVGVAESSVGSAENAVRNAEASVKRAEAGLTQADKDLKRSQDLFDKGVVARAELDLAQTSDDTAKATLEGAKAAADGARSEVNVARSRVTSAKAALKVAEGNIPTLKAEAATAKDAVAVAEAQLSYAKMVSPVDAVVEYRTLEPGEVVAPGQTILTLVDMSTMWVRIDLQQMYAARVKAGNRAEITIDSMPGKVLEGEVFDIGREGEFATERDVTRGQQDIKTFRTRIRVKDPEGILKPGMTVSVTIPVQ